MRKDTYSISKALGDVLERGSPTGYEAECHFEELRTREKTPLLARLPSSASHGGRILPVPLNALGGRRDVAVGGPSGGASLVGEKHEITSPLLTWSVCLRAGAQSLSGLVQRAR